MFSDPRNAEKTRRVSTYTGVKMKAAMKDAGNEKACRLPSGFAEAAQMQHAAMSGPVPIPVILSIRFSLAVHFSVPRPVPRRLVVI
jgi:hypothetical protein